MPDYHSTRARILSQVLEYFNNKDWDDFHGFLVFGREAFEAWCESPRHTGETVADRELRRLVTKVKVTRGARDVAKKISIENLSPDSTVTDIFEWLKTFHRDDLQRLTDELGRTAKSMKRPNAATQLAFDSDAIDAALAGQFVKLLDSTMTRIGDYDNLRRYQTNPKVARYFEEVHRCFLFGMNIACAVLCRAFLEAALIERVGPQRQSRKSVGRQDSAISRMIVAAASVGLLKENRPAKAEAIKEAGDLAIHNYDEFRKTYSHRMGEIVDDMRKILMDLYVAEHA
ncbi:MAG: hypothetical protein LAO78_15595 [Acidobacteriia bacterium]|nr:hypothetical protein [Terriglobia bacterium]